MKDSVALFTNGKCVYNHEVCAREARPAWGATERVQVKETLCGR